ncbi:MAG: glycine--tRNA ligase [candidate division KSB1 bacterium]|jgi:glycyl-tRNA synthetase|nr:glycine--tRNA ligase [candidate division KSB1 bacterium]
MAEKTIMDKIVSLCKRKGFIFQSSEIYGGITSCYDYGPMGIELKKNIKEYWWRSMVVNRSDVEGLDAAILMHPRVWEASGHVSGFTDPLVDCKKCKHRFRADQIETDGICPDCGGELTEERQFNLMFKTFMGPLEEAASVVYLRPETAQGIYVNFQNVQQASRQKVPFGIAQIGKAFRNEITPGNFTFRTREFEQMEMQFFVKPGTDGEWFEYWKERRMNWYHHLQVDKNRLRFHQHGDDELAHYASAAFDVEYEFPFGTLELEGIHNRTDFDLTRHKEFSGKDMSYFDESTRERFIPYIIETSAGVDRTLLTCLIDAYEEEQLEKDTRVVLHLAPFIAPLKAAIFPLVKRDGMPEMAHKIESELREHFMVFYDEGGAVGRRYRRQDEVGTPFCITVDSQSLEDQTVTVRERDSMKQDRVAIDKLQPYLTERVKFPVI